MSGRSRPWSSFPRGRRGLAVLSLSAFSLASLMGRDAEAVGPSKGAVAAPKTTPRSLRRPQSDEAAALEGLRTRVGDFLVEIDTQTQRPSRLLLAGAPVPHSSAGDGVAARHAHELLPALLPYLSPASTAGDFRLSRDHYDASSQIRTLAFEQTHLGRPVEAAGRMAAISLRYKHDRLVAIANESLPVRAPAGAVATLTATQLRDAAQTFEDQHYGSSARLEFELANEAHWWMASRDGKAIARLVYAVEARRVDGVGANRLLLDARSGELLERRSLIFWGESQLRYNVPIRWPEGGRMPYAVSDASIATSDGGNQVTDANGTIAYPGNSTLFTHALDGPYASVSNEAGPLGTTTGMLQNGQTLTLGYPNDGEREAQLTSFIHTNRVKDRVRFIAPEFAWVDTDLPVNVNIEDTCNAFWDGQSINFFLEGSGCANTGRLADVVYHEYGHGVHQNAIIPGVGAMSISLSEGISDYLTATIVNDSGMGRGFFLGSGEPLRELDPVDFEWTWPEDIGEVHDEGRIIGGAFWDLRERMRQKYGNADGTAHTDRLWFESIRRAVDIPSAYFEVLVADDDDGNLMNGTPNVCEINEAFGAHGLFQVPGIADSVELIEGDDSMRLELEMTLPFAQCGTEAEIEVQWRDRDNPEDIASTSLPASEGLVSVEIPKPVDGTVLQWAVEIHWNVGSSERHPSNLVDPWYETYIGPVIPLYCTSFEEGLAGWAATDDLWELGNQGGGNASGDPQAPADGELFVGTRLTGDDGLYPPGADSLLFSPFISTEGYSTIRLQYWRDLNVEDGFFDQAYILANGESAWSNFASPDDFAATRHHRDARWRFHDVDLSDYVFDGGVEVGFGLRSDFGLHFGGWNVDDFCVVAVDGPVCGNGVLEPGEGCDDGNNQNGDGCSADCEVEGGEEGEDAEAGVDESEVGTGFGEEGPGQVAARGCGCRADGRPSGTAGLMLLAFFGALRRRRRA